MKRMKKCAVLLIVLALVVALGATAYADTSTTCSITIENPMAGETYYLYKMLTVTVNEDFTSFAYKLNGDAWDAFFKTGGTGASYVTVDTKNNVTFNTGADQAAFFASAGEYSKGTTVTATKSAVAVKDTNLVFDNLPAGYYLITTTGGKNIMVSTTPDNPNPSIKDKNDIPDIDKQVQEDSTNTWGNNNSAQIGDTVYFKTTITLQSGATNYIMHDKMDDGLTLNAESIAIDGLTKGTDYTVAVATSSDPLADGCTFEITFADSYLATVTNDTKVIVTYNAVLNENADIKNGEDNDAKFTWGNISTTEWSTTNTKTYSFSVLKYAGSDKEEDDNTTKTPLAGAVFQLQTADGTIVKLIKVGDTEYRVANCNETGAQETFTTVATDKITIKGVDLDKYKLVEITAPEGYNLLEEPVEVTVETSNAVCAEIANKQGAKLPSTGGTGTTMIYVVGSVLVAAAVVMFITKKRMDAER